MVRRPSGGRQADGKRYGKTMTACHGVARSSKWQVDGPIPTPTPIPTIHHPSNERMKERKAMTSEQIRKLRMDLDAKKSVVSGPTEMDKAIVLALVRHKRGEGPAGNDPLGLDAMRAVEDALR